MGPVIELRSVSKRFRLRGSRSGVTTLKSAVVEFVRRSRRHEEAFAALRAIDMSVGEGRTVGVIGTNGSGKSTLLKLIAGIHRPDSGTVRVRGRVAPLIELGAGFHPQFTGRENIVINGILLGLSRREVARRADAIIEFADIGAFIDEPARTYSSGMYVRLGFAVAVHLDPDVLLFDEVLAVGDEAFARKCVDRIAEFQRLGKTMLLVTHDLGAVERWCDEVVWLDRGAIHAVGPPRKVVDLYREALAGKESDVLAESYQAGEPRPADRWGGREIEIVRVRMHDAGGQERYVYQTGEPVTLRLGYRVHRAVDDVVFGFGILRSDGLWVYGTNTALGRIAVPRLGPSGEVEVRIEALDLVAGSYFLDVAVHAEKGVPYDYHSRRYPFSIRSDSGDIGVARLHHRWRINPDG